MKKRILIFAGVALSLIVSTYASPEGDGKSRPNPEERVARVLENNDADADGALNAAELEQFIVQMKEKRKEHIAKMRAKHEEQKTKGPHGESWKNRTDAERAGRLLEKFDVDGSGSLDSAELLEAFRSLRDRKHRAMHDHGHGHEGPPPVSEE
ncbi:MAG: hypothetical protein JKY51_07540 [Opitutaceae bacterium]|nr:hypothetical protein [Opitutaceae bacterium]